MMLFKRRRTRRRAMSGAAVGVVVATALVAQMSIVSNASWTDEEWVSADSVGTVSCTDPEGAFATRGEGKLLSGSLLGINLDTLAEVKGVEVTNDGSRSDVSPENTLETPVGSDAYSNPLNVELLSLANLDLSGLLELPLETRTGVVGQYAKATELGQSIGASGTVTNEGGISLEQFQGNVPDLATLSLSGLLNSNELGLGSLLENVADLDLSVGAVAGRAWLDGCAESWDAPDALTRDYLASHLNLNLESPLVGSLGSIVDDTVNLLETTSNSLIGDQNVLSGVVGSVVALVTGVLSSGLISALLGTLLGFRVAPNGTSTAKITVLDLDLSAVRDLISQPVSDPDGVLSVNLSEGLISVNTAALLEAAYPGSGGLYPNGLNGLSPNTNPLQDEQVLATLSTRLGSLLGGIVNNANGALDNALNNARVNIEISIPTETRSCTLLLICGPWETHPLLITVSGPLSGLLSNSDDLVINVDLSAIPLLGNLLTPLTNALVSGLKGTIGGILGTVIDGLLRPLATLPATIVDTAVQPILLLVQRLYTDLFLAGVVAITFNAQNDPFSGSPEPNDWVTETSSGIPNGQYDVAALRVGVLDSLGQTGVSISLGRGSVGPVCAPVSVMAGGCAGY